MAQRWLLFSSTKMLLRQSRISYGIARFVSSLPFQHRNLLFPGKILTSAHSQIRGPRPSRPGAHRVLRIRRFSQQCFACLIFTARLSEHVKRPDLRTRPSDSRTAKAPDSHTGQPPRPFPRSLYLCHRRARRFGSTWVSNRHSGSKRRLSMTQELRQEKRKEKKRGSSTRS